MRDYYHIVQEYVKSTLDDPDKSKWEKGACKRYLSDVKDPRYEENIRAGSLAVRISESMLFYIDGNDLRGNALAGRPIVWEPWQVFILYNLYAIYHRGTTRRKYTRRTVSIARKNFKTGLAAAVSLINSILESESGAATYIVAKTAEQATVCFDYVYKSFTWLGWDKDPKIIMRDNEKAHLIEYDFGTGASFKIQTLAGGNSKAFDGFKANCAVCDEVHVITRESVELMLGAMKSYQNKMLFLISTAGTNPRHWFYAYREQCKQIIEGIAEAPEHFIFIAEAEADADGYIDYTDERAWKQANPNYGVSIRKEDMEAEARDAQNDAEKRSFFISRSLNRYVNAVRVYFNADEIKASDASYDWTIEDLAKMPIEWRIGADLSKMHDLTAIRLYGNYDDGSEDGVDICISHCFCPVTMAHQHAHEDMPIFGWANDGIRTLSNDTVVNFGDVVKQIDIWKGMGFNIVEVCYDRKFSMEFIAACRDKGYSVHEIQQTYINKSAGFRRIERQIKKKKFYFLHNSAYLYGITNVKAVEKADDLILFEKAHPTDRIDTFDSSVFRAIGLIESIGKDNKREFISSWKW